MLNILHLIRAFFDHLQDFIPCKMAHKFANSFQIIKSKLTQSLFAGNLQKNVCITLNVSTLVLVCPRNNYTIVSVNHMEKVIYKA